ncbi:hypothetical protein CIW83_07620 [Tissierella sp. P1]|uniref:prepilin-type N-terminal cleavage/methylation domain-containing protein n=1 Tax=Tissierella sp. P1 TaxID=1280483 RepID=UPI000BA133F2|nr:prepilin-type N-terminal cleavage/methylation domain-containing protein [Tissierella sp. P1]OZV12754.1 hypothetical protein CIW83_07620 [Tissierella sp. P1]
MINNKRSGLTLIEVILAMLILSILLITYITAFGQGSIIVNKGKDITKDTFSYQEIMENLIIDVKRNFIENDEAEDYKIEIFTDYGDYKTAVDVKEIRTDIRGNRQYVSYVTNYQIKEPESPKIEPFSVGVYDSEGNRVFPWYEDDIRIRASYTLQPTPLIFENRIRWYRSKEGISNPVFSSDYDMVFEDMQKEPNAINYTKELIKSNNLLSKRFYYFEARPYTLAGRLEHFRNEDRILILNRAGSEEWQDFLEDIYFNREAVKIFDRNSEEIYLDIMQNPEHPTLNLEWSDNKDPQGALIAMKVPDTYSNTNFETRVNFRIDPKASAEGSDLLGIGIGLININNSGIMVNLDIFNSLISINQIENGVYKKVIQKNSLTDSLGFENFINENTNKFDWAKEYTLIFQYLKNNNKIKIRLEDKEVSSDFIEIDLQGYNIFPNYIGFKSYSGMDYKPNTKYEIINKYDRNYSSHLYDVRFSKINLDDESILFMFGGGLDISASNIIGENKSIYFDSNLNLENIKNNGHIKVSNIYVKENLEFPKGSHELGSSEEPGEIHVNGDFIESGNRNIYGDLFIGGNFISKSSSSSIYGNLHVGKNLTLWDGSMNLYGDIFVNGNFKLKDARIHRNVYVNGNVELGWTPWLGSNSKIYYTGTLTYPNNYNQDILNRLIKVNGVEEPKKPTIPEPKYPTLKEDSWYLNNGYVSGGKLKDNIKIYANSYVQSSWTQSVEDIIIVAKTGDIRIENFGGSTIKGILFAPNGKVYLNGGSFEGLIIAKNGIDYVQGGGNITIKDIDEIIKDSSNYPFK